MVYKSKHISAKSAWLLSQGSPAFIKSHLTQASQRYFGVSHPSMALKPVTDNQELKTTEEVKMNLEGEQNKGSGFKSGPLLQFVKQQPHLRQLQARFPNDGHYPIIKEYKDYNREDVKELIDLGKWAQVSDVIRAIDHGTLTSSSDFLTCLAAHLHDKNYELCKQLYERITDLQLGISPLVMNYLLQNAAMNQQFEQVNQLLAEASFTGVQIDMNTYLRILTTVFYENDIPFDRRDFITQIYILFSNDHYPDDFQFGTDLLNEYLKNNFQEYQSYDKYIKNKKAKKAKKAQQAAAASTAAQVSGLDQAALEQDLASAASTLDGGKQQAEHLETEESDDSSESEEQLGGGPNSTVSSGMYASSNAAMNGQSSGDAINDMLVKRKNLYKNQMIRSKNKLSRGNNEMKSSRYQQDKTSRHINKYDQNQIDNIIDQLPQFMDEAEISRDPTQQQDDVEVKLQVDLGSLRDIDQSPQNIKELSKIMADQISKMLTSEIDKMNQQDIKKQRTVAPPQLNMKSSSQQNHHQLTTETMMKDRVLTFDLSSFKNNATQHRTQHMNQLNNPIDKFNLDTFLNGEQNAAYMTTQEEGTTESHGLQQRKQSTQQQQDKHSANLTDSADAREEHARKSIIKEDFKDQDGSGEGNTNNGGNSSNSSSNAKN